jgi:ATP-dependent DNA ligase
VSIPSFIPPCLPSYATEVPLGPAWIYEIKHDGYRFMCHIDGECVVCDDHGIADFNELRRALLRENAPHAVLCV